MQGAGGAFLTSCLKQGAVLGDGWRGWGDPTDISHRVNVRVESTAPLTQTSTTTSTQGTVYKSVIHTSPEMRCVTTRTHAQPNHLL